MDADFRGFAQANFNRRCSVFICGKEVWAYPHGTKTVMKATVFLGGGRITSALAAGLRLAGDERQLIAYDRHPKKLRALQRESRVEIARNLKAAIESAAMLIVAVRPASVKQMLGEVADSGAKPPKLCISLAAGIPLKNLLASLGSVHWVRAMPSPVCRIRRGLTPLTFDASVTKVERSEVRRLFEKVGPLLEIPERQMDVITATHSPTHGYHALATLAKAAQNAGLDRDTALMAAAHALSDGTIYWRESGLSLDELLHEAATPGGIAAATMTAMDKAGYARGVERGVAAGIRRARQNAKL
jgi:pyrroline-5-carboxylate reductase